MTGDLETPETGGGFTEQRLQHWHSRLMMLCDGVFAIAITFLGADVGAPAGWNGDGGVLWSHLATQLDAYAISFLVVSIFWLAHRRFMAMIQAVDAPMTVLTLILLGLLVLVPAATRLISVHGTLPAARLTYAALIVAIGLVISALWAYAALIAKVVSPEVSPRLRWFLLFLMLWTPPFFLWLTFSLGMTRPGMNPAFLAILFLIGWRMRLWTVRRLGGHPHAA